MQIGFMLVYCDLVRVDKLNRKTLKVIRLMIQYMRIKYNKNTTQQP